MHNPWWNLFVYVFDELPTKVQRFRDRRLRSTWS